MRVAIVITKPEHGGAQSHVLGLVRQLKRDHELWVASSTEGWLLEQLRSIGVNTAVLPRMRTAISPSRELAAVNEMRDWLRAIRPDVLHLHSSKAGFIGRVAAWLERVPVVFTAHGWAFTPGAPPARRAVALLAEWMAARLGGHVIAVSQFDFELANQFGVVPRHRLHCVPNGVSDVPSSMVAAVRGRGPVRLGMVARFAPPKNQMLILRALERLKAHLWTCEFVGDGPDLDAAEAGARQMGLTDRVRFLGARDDVPRLLATWDVCMLASRYEGLPMSIIEAMRAGVAVVASNVGGVPELVVPGRTGFIAENTVESWCHVLEKIVVGGCDLAAMGAAGRERFEQHFTLEAMSSRVEEVYRVAVQGRL